MKNKSNNNLKEYQERAGLSQMEVAKALGFNTNNRISRWEKGIAYPNIFNLLKLSRIYKKDPFEIYDQATFG